jgi:hypothetical protein
MELLARSSTGKSGKPLPITSIFDRPRTAVTWSIITEECHGHNHTLVDEEIRHGN